jgi:Kef-type K+ transport system membrane component KefB
VGLGELQVETVAQFGVVFLLFALGLEFSMSKLRVVRAVAVIGGFLQIALFMCLCSLTAVVCFLYFSHLTYMDSSQAIFTLQTAQAIECFVLHV